VILSLYAMSVLFAVDSLISGNVWSLGVGITMAILGILLEKKKGL